VSTQVFPSTLKGFDIKILRTPVYATMIQAAASGKELRASLQSYPRYRFTLQLNFARQAGYSTNTPFDEAGTITRFFMAHMACWDSFLLTDPYGSTVTAQPFGVGNASTVAFQLQRCEPGNWSGPASNYWPATGSGFEPIFEMNGAPSIYVNGVLKTVGTDYTISNGLVTFTVAPGNGLVLTWTGSYYRRCRFDVDELEMERLCGGAWAGNAIKLFSTK